MGFHIEQLGIGTVLGMVEMIGCSGIGCLGTMLLGASCKKALSLNLAVRRISVVRS